MDERRQLEEAIAVQESLRGTVDDAIIDATIATLREKLAVIEASPVPDQQRKLISLLFTDIAGSTTIVRDMDPEDNMELMDGALKKMGKAVEEHGGRVTRYMGDGFKAVFGAPLARENDAEMAVRAGLGILATAKEIAAQVEKEWGVTNFQVRVGVNTGLAALGGETEAEDTIMGSMVNLGARLESAAPAGGLLISHETYNHVRGIFEVELMPPIEAKGFVEPVRVYLVKQARARKFRMSTRGVEGAEARMVGRETELKHLQDALFTAMEEGEGQMVTITGEAGVGKSRLLYEFQNWIEDWRQEVRIFEGRSVQETQNIPYSLLRDIFATQFQIKESDKASQVRGKVETGFMEQLGEDKGGRMRAHIIGQLLGFDFSTSGHLKDIHDDPQQLRDRGLIYLSEYFAAITKNELRAIFLEDIHWADDSSLDAIDHLGRKTPEQPLVIVCLARHRLFEQRPYWGEGQPYHIRLDLHPLTKRESRQLVGEILEKVEEMPQALRDLVVEGAEGNPYYIEELINMLIEERVIVKEGDKWAIEPVRMAEITIPSTLMGVLQARLDSLPQLERTTLQKASVVGRVFWDNTVKYINQETDEDFDQEIDSSLAGLRGKEMVYRRETSAFSEAGEYTFKHSILRDVTYESVLKRARKVYHGLVADWLIDQGGERVNEYTGLIANHLEAAGRPAQAITYLKLAGDLAASRYANEEALSYFDWALGYEAELDAEGNWEIYSAREKVLDHLGKRTEQLQDLRVLEELAAEMANLEKQAEVALRLVSYGEATRSYPEELETAELAVNLARQLQDRSLEGRGYLGWGKAVMLQGGDRDTAQKLFKRARQIFKEIGDVRLEGHACRALGFVHFQNEDYRNAIRFSQCALKLARESNDRRAEGYALTNLANTLNTEGKLQESREILRQSLSLAQEIGNRRGEAYVLGALAEISAQMGYYDRAKDIRLESLSLLREVGDQRVEVTALKALGMLASYRSDFNESLNLLEQARALTGRIGNLGMEDVLDAHCEVYTVMGDYETASDYGRQSIQIQEDSHRENIALISRANLSEALFGEGKLMEAKQQIEEILAHNKFFIGLVGEDDPLKIYLNCVKVLKAVEDPRADEVLKAGYQFLMDTAANITNEADRLSYLENVPWHREILEIWAAKEGRN